MSPPSSLPRSQVELENFNEILFPVDHLDLTNKRNQFTEEFLVDDLLDLRGMPEPEKKAEETKEDTKEASFITFEKNEALLLSEISLPEETEAAHLEWLSRFVNDCHSPEPPSAPPFTAAPAIIPVKSKRSKRRRSSPVLWSLSLPSLLRHTSPVSSFTPISSSSSSSNNTVHRNFFCATESYMPKKRGRKPRNLFHGNGAGKDRRCAHCGAQKTPQWRAGPDGPKTLCNACGVRFKSGRLLPEYRPACSPTFISKVHSNSHRKVLEMRRKKDERIFTASAPAVHSC